MLDPARLQALLGYDRDTAERFALHWHQVGHDAREASDWMQYHNVNVLQGIMWVNMSPSCENTGETSRANRYVTPQY